MNRFIVGQDCKTAYERIKGKKPTRYGLEFGEKLWFKKKDGQKMEKLNATEQISSFVGASGPNVFIVPHGAGTTHVSYLEPCSVVIEVVPYNYPQYSFMMPTLRSGSFMLYMIESTALAFIYAHSGPQWQHQLALSYSGHAIAGT